MWSTIHMFSLTIRNHMMIAHTLPDPFFGPAQGMHGATFVTEVSFRAPALDNYQVVLDIGAASEHLEAVLATLRYRNLDEVPELAGQLTTTEFMASYVAHQVWKRLSSAGLGGNLSEIAVVLRENPDAWAEFAMAVPPGGE